jgi:hypothetical protein
MSIAGLTDKDRILRLARARGDQGFTAVDMQLPHVADGGKPILRVAARVKDLRDEGFVFHSGGTRNRCRIYILDAAYRGATEPAPTSGPSAPDCSSSSTAGADGTGALFEIGRAQQSAINDDWEAA